MPEALHHLAPRAQPGGRPRQAEVRQHQFVQPLFGQDQGQLVDRMPNVLLFDHRVQGDVAEQRQLLAHLGAQGNLGAADQRVGQQPQFPQPRGALLRRLGLDLARGLDEGYVREVNHHHVLAPFLQPDLPDGLEEGHALDVAHRSADLAQDNIHPRLREVPEAGFDLVGDMRDHLHGPAEVIPVPFLPQHLPIDFARGEIAFPGGGLPGEPLVVAQVQVRLGPVVGHIDLAVLVGTHGSGIHIEIGIHLDHADRQPPADQQPAQRRGGEALPKRGNHAAGDKDELGHERIPP